MCAPEVNFSLNRKTIGELRIAFPFFVREGERLTGDVDFYSLCTLAVVIPALNKIF